DRFRDLRLLLADRHVDAQEVAALLVDDRVDGEGRFAGLPVADDQLALAAADRDHRVERLDPGLHRRVYRLPEDDAGRDALRDPRRRRTDGPFAVDGLPEAI